MKGINRHTVYVSDIYTDKLTRMQHERADVMGMSNLLNV